MTSNAFLRARLLLIMESNSVNFFDPNKIVRHAPFSGFLRKKPCECRWRSWLVHKSHTFLVCLLTRFAKFFLMKLPAVEISQWFLLKKLHAMGETCTLFTMGFANPQVQDLRSALVREARPEMALPLYHLKFWKWIFESNEWVHGCLWSLISYRIV